MGNSQTKSQIKGRNKKQVHWKAAEHPGPPGKPELVASVDATPDVVTIRWDKPKSDGGSPITGYLVEHRRTGSPHWVRATPLLILYTELTLSGLEPGWRYQFRVTAQNSVGMSDPGEVSEPLTVTLQRSIITAPKFSEELKDCSALENEMAEFVVHVIGQPPPKVCWYKDGFEIFSSRRTRITTENGKSVLTIHQVALADEGEIKCTATNRAGHASTKGFVKVDAPPKIRLPRQYEDGLLFELDEVIRLKVSIAGRPQPLVFWSHNGESISNDERYEVIESDKFSTLRVGEARRSDRGEYQIRAVNKIGEDSTSFLVTVTDRPKPPENVKVIMALGKSVTLSWSEPEDDGGCKIGAYIVEYFRVGWNVWLKASTCRHMTTMLNDLIEGSEYKFRVKAESPYGVSDPSDETDVIFIPDPKRGLMSAPPRSRSQPREAVGEDLPVPPKRRSASTTRNQSRENSGIVIPDTVPVRPKRDKIKSPPKTPDQSPLPTRRDAGINTNMFDRASMARELAYGFDVKAKRTELKHPSPNQLEVKPSSRSPSPNSRTKSASRLNTILSSILPTKKSPSPSKKSPSPKESKQTVEQVVNPTVDIPMTVQMLEVRSERSDLFDRSPSPMERRLSLKMNGDGKDKGNKSPSPSKKSPSPSRLDTQSNGGSRRGSVRSNRRNSLDNEEQGSSEFMLVLFPEHGDKYYPDHEDSSLMFFDLDDDQVPPPMSLSAPELGAEPPVFEPLRTSVSSSELLYERSLARFRQAAEAEEAAEEAKRLERRHSTIGNGDGKIKILEEYSGDRRLSIPKIQINSKDQEEGGLDRKASFKRRLSAGGANITQQYVWAKRRQSLRNQVDYSDLSEVPKIKSEEQKSTSRSPEKAAQIPKSSPDRLDPAEKRKEMLSRQRSESEEKEEEAFSKVRARMEQEKRAIKTGAKDMTVMKEDKWEEDSEESLSETESEPSEDERFKYDIMPPLIQAKEEETYHPRTMNMVPKPSKSDEPFEILTKPNPLPDPNFVPKPILKKPDEAKKPAPEKPVRKLLGNEFQSISPSPDVSPERTRSRTPSPSPGRTIKQVSPIRTTAAESQIQQSAADAAKNKRNLIRNNSDEENSVVIDYYGAIVQQYSSLKRTKPVEELEREEPIPNLSSALDILDKYVKTVPQEEEDPYKEILSPYHEPKMHYEDQQVKETNRFQEFQRPVEQNRHSDILSRYQDTNRYQKSSSLNQEQRGQESHSQDNISRRQPSPSPFMRKPFGEASQSSNQEEMNKIFKKMELNERERQPSPKKEDIRRPSDEVRRDYSLNRRQFEEQRRQNSPTKRPIGDFRQSSPNRSQIEELIRQSSPSRQEESSGLSSRPEVLSRRPAEIGSGRQRMPSKTRKRSTSRNRQRSAQRAATPSDLKNKLEMITRTPSPPLTPDQEAMKLEAELKLRSSIDYLTDVTMFFVACWLYFFSNPLFAIPVLVITVYRQLKDEVRNRLPSWMVKKQ